MLYLRRRPDESFFIFDHMVEVQVRVHSVNLDAASTVLEITGIDEPVEVNPPAHQAILQGEGDLHIKQIVNVDDDPTQSFVVIGIEAPRTMRILREELVRGVTRKQRAKIVF